MTSHPSLPLARISAEQRAPLVLTAEARTKRVQQKSFSPSSWLRELNAPVDIASLAVFRMLFGAVMCAAMIRFLAKGWVQELFVAPAFHFTYDDFSWVRPWPGTWMHLHVAALAVLALGVALGLFYRWCITLFFLGFTYLELIDQTTYLNHYYLVTLLSGLLIWMPAGRAWSLDAWRRPQLASAITPAWTLWLLRFQLGVVYFFAGVAKLNADWLFAAQPLRLWLGAKTDLPLVGPWLGEAWVAHAASWFGALYDLGIVAFLLWRRTRPAAYGFVVLFHVATWVLFPIGMFPWVMLAATTLFFEPNWARRWMGCFTNHQPQTSVPARLNSRWACAALGIYVLWQIVFPLREFVYRGASGWTYEGFNFAWKVMIVEKAGHVEFTARDPATGRTWPVRSVDYLTPLQQKMMAQDPAMIRSLARHVAESLAQRGLAGVEIRATAYATLNGRPSQLMLDPNMNLAAPVSSGWILPLEK